jgi:hypothetical protein
LKKNDSEADGVVESALLENSKDRSKVERKGNKYIWHRIKKSDKITLKEVSEMIKKIQKENPDQEVFFDGDEYAICSVPLDPAILKIREASKKAKTKLVQSKLIESL